MATAVRPFPDVSGRAARGQRRGRGSVNRSTNEGYEGEPMRPTGWPRRPPKPKPKPDADTAELPRRCPACANRVQPGDRFCAECGERLPDPAAPAR